MTARFAHIDIANARASAREALVQRKTCEGCAALRRIPTPMCAREQSPHFRSARDTYHDRCQWYAVAGQEPKPPEPKPAPEPPKSKRMKLVKVRGTNRLVTEAEYDRLLARGRMR